jgi:hypothetical protein
MSGSIATADSQHFWVYINDARHHAFQLQHIGWLKKSPILAKQGRELSAKLGIASVFS